MTEETDIMHVAEVSAYGGMNLFIGNALSTGILAICSIIIGRLLGPSNYGLYSLVIVVPSLLIGLVDFGITSAIIRFSAKFRAEGKVSDVRKVIKVGVLFELIVGLLASLFCFVFSYSLSSLLINRPEASFYVRTVSFLILFQTLFNGLSSALIGLDRMKANAFIMTIRASAKFLLSPLLIIVGLGIFGALLGQVVCYAIGVAVGIASLSLMLFKSHDDPGPSSGIFKTMVKYGLPLFLSALVGLILTPYESIVLAFFTSNTEIGNFQIVTLFGTAIGLLTYPLLSLFPAFSKLNVQNGQLGQFFKRSVKYTSVLLVPVAVAIAILSKDLIYTLYGSSFALAPIFLAFSMMGNLYAALGSAVFGYLFNGIGRTDVSLKSSLITFLIFLPLAPLLTFLFGVMGLIGASLISSFASQLYFLAVADKQVKTRPDFRTSANIFLVTAFSAVVLFAFLQASPFGYVPNLILGGAIFCFAYLTLLPILGVLTSTDMEIFKRLFYKTKGARFILKLLISYETKILGYKQRHIHKV